MQTPERDQRFRGDRRRRAEVIDDEFVAFGRRNRPAFRKVGMTEKHMELRPVDHDAGRLLGSPLQTLHVDDHRGHQPGKITLADSQSRSESDGPGLDRESRILGKQCVHGRRESSRVDACFEIPKQRLLHQGVSSGAGVGRDPDVTCIEQRPEPNRRILETVRVRLGDGEMMTLPLRKVGTRERRLEIGVRDSRSDVRRGGLDRCVPGHETVRDQQPIPGAMRNHRFVGRIDVCDDPRGGVEVALGEKRFGEPKLGDGIDLRGLDVGTMPERRQNRDEGHRDERKLPRPSPNDARWNRHVDRSRIGHRTFGLGGL